nr:immunoglobulin light chain junction region [Macaca mulatta]
CGSYRSGTTYIF